MLFQNVVLYLRIGFSAAASHYMYNVIYIRLRLLEIENNKIDLPKDECSATLRSHCEIHELHFLSLHYRRSLSKSKYAVHCVRQEKITNRSHYLYVFRLARST